MDWSGGGDKTHPRADVIRDVYEQRDDISSEACCEMKGTAVEMADFAGSYAGPLRGQEHGIACTSQNGICVLKNPSPFFGHAQRRGPEHADQVSDQSKRNNTSEKSAEEVTGSRKAQGNYDKNIDGVSVIRDVNNGSFFPADLLGNTRSHMYRQPTDANCDHSEEASDDLAAESSSLKEGHCGDEQHGRRTGSQHKYSGDSQNGSAQSAHWEPV